MEGAIDLEGDLFAAMSIADSIEEIRMSFGDRMRIPPGALARLRWLDTTSSW